MENFNLIGLPIDGEMTTAQIQFGWGVFFILSNIPQLCPETQQPSEHYDGNRKHWSSRT